MSYVFNPLTGNLDAVTHVFDRIVYAEEYGATMDGSTDDTTSIQDAIDVAETLGGGIVQLAEGTAIVSQLVIKNRVWLRGMGKYATKLESKAGSTVPVVINYVSTDGTEGNAEFISISDLLIDGNKATNTNTAVHGIYLETNPLSTKATNDDWHDTHQRIFNVMIVRCAGKGFYATGRSEIRLDNVYIEKCDLGGFEPAYDSFLSNCSAGDNGAFGFSLTHGSVHLTNCKAFNTGTETGVDAPGFYISGSGLAGVLAGCTAQNNTGAGFFLEDATGFTIHGVADSNNKGTGNATDAFAGIELDNSTNNNIYCIATQGLQGGVVIGNQKHALRLINLSNLNNIIVSTIAQAGYTLGTTMTSDSRVMMNVLMENGSMTSSGDVLGLARDNVLSQNGPRLRFMKRGNGTVADAMPLNGTELGGLDFLGYDSTLGTFGSPQVKFIASAGQDWTNANKGTSFTIQTTQNNTTTLGNAFRVTGNKQATFYGDMFPTTTLTLNCGTSSLYWLATNAQTLNLNSTASINGTTAGKIEFVGTNYVFNETGADADFRIEGDTDANLFTTDASVDRVGIGTNAPTSKVDINSNGIRLRTARTITNSNDTGTTGEICWDANYIYVCTATNTWKRTAIATW